MANVFKSILHGTDYMARLNICYSNMVVSNDYHSLVMELDDAYNIMKEAAATLCVGKNSLIYEKLRDRLIDCEDLCDDTFIIESCPDFDACDKRFFGKSVNSIPRKQLIEFIVWFNRCRLFDNIQDQAYQEDQDFFSFPLTDYCKLSASIVSLLCKTLNVECEIIKIPPGFTDRYELYGGNGFHYFCLITIDDVKYVVDTTYRQFFTLDSNNINRMGVMGLDGCNPGIYMLMNPSRRKTAYSILKKGYVLATDENLKNYFDGFALSYRNGLYYEDLGEADYSTTYSVSDYFAFLSDDKCLFDYEDVDFLAEQDRPLENKNFRFKI